MARHSGRPEYDGTHMPSARTTQSRILRAVAIAAAASPLGVAWALASCVLADPPPSLSPIPTEMPEILRNSAVPPEGTFTGWPVGTPFQVTVQIINPTEPVLYAMVEDDDSSAAALIPMPNHEIGPSPGGTITIPIPEATVPADGNCHTFTLYVDAIEDGITTSGSAGAWSAMNGAVTCNPQLCNSIKWTYEPAGLGGTCPAFDPGALRGRDASAD